jgi:hypothetical protein
LLEERDKMPIIERPFTYYAFSYSSPANAKTSIYLLDGPGMPFRPIAVLVFYSGEVPTNSVDPSGVPVVRFPRGAFAEIIDLLRNERPLELIWDSDNLIGSIRSAAAEPVGEEES